MSANLEQWKFSIEETKEGARVEIHIRALNKKSRNDTLTEYKPTELDWAANRSIVNDAGKT